MEYPSLPKETYIKKFFFYNQLTDYIILWKKEKNEEVIFH